MSLSPTDYLLWGISATLLVLTCGTLLQRRLVREVPVFFTYATFHVLRSAALFTLHLLWLQQRMSYVEYYADYFYTYWTTESVGIVLGFGVIYEIYKKTFKNYDGVRQLGSLALGGAAVVLLIAAVVTAATASGADAPGIVKAVVLMERSVRVMQCGLLAVLFLLVFYFGLPWQNRLFGLALGFGLYASVELVAIALRSHLGVTAATAYSQAKSAAYVAGVMIWLGYLLAPDPAPEYRGAVLHGDLERWNQAVREILKP
jgi:hypothetical protein